MDRLGIRELRNQTASAVRRAGGGERIVITVDGRPVAQLGPLEPGAGEPHPRRPGRPRPARRSPADPTAPGPAVAVPVWAGCPARPAPAGVRAR